MANKNFIHFVENPCKNPCKTVCKFIAKKCVKKIKKLSNVYNTNLSSNFSHVIHQEFHNLSPLKFNYFFHYSTDPTITTIK